LAAELSSGRSNNRRNKQLFTKTTGLITESFYSMAKKILLPAFIAVILFSACKKDPETLGTAPISDYVPLEVGKYITYQLDSVRYIPFTLQQITIRYQAKFIVDAQVTDNLGRPAYRIVRQIRSNPTDAWVNDNSFTAVLGDESYEFVDNNLRFLKLRGPVKDGFTWKGNSYINTTSQYSDFTYLDGWDYMFDSVAAPLTLGAINLDNTVKIAQRDNIDGNPDDPSSYSGINYGVEYYAKGIGLVYKRFFHSEYQPPTTPGPIGSYTQDSKGFTLTMIDHN
jgi:hypothetical protein